MQLEKNVCQKVVKIVEDLDEIKKRNKSRSDSEVILGKYDELFDVSLKEVAINDNANELLSISTNATDNVMDTETNELPIKRATKRPAEHKDFYDDPSNLFEALSVADQDDLDKDWSPDEVEALEVDPVEYDKFKLYIEICERFNFSTYEGTQLPKGAVTNLDHSHTKVRVLLKYDHSYIK